MFLTMMSIGLPSRPPKMPFTTSPGIKDSTPAIPAFRMPGSAPATADIPPLVRGSASFPTMPPSTACASARGTASGRSIMVFVTVPIAVPVRPPPILPMTMPASEPVPPPMSAPGRLRSPPAVPPVSAPTRVPVAAVVISPRMSSLEPSVVVPSLFCAGWAVLLPVLVRTSRPMRVSDWERKSRISPAGTVGWFCMCCSMVPASASGSWWTTVCVVGDGGVGTSCAFAIAPPALRDSVAAANPRATLVIPLMVFSSVRKLVIGSVIGIVK